MQGVYEPVLEAILEVQPQWHDDPQLKAAWNAAATAGLDIQRPCMQAAEPSIAENLALDIEDAKAYDVTRTPTFFVNGKPVEPSVRAALQSGAQRSCSNEGARRSLKAQGFPWRLRKKAN